MAKILSWLLSLLFAIFPFLRPAPAFDWKVTADAVANAVMVKDIGALEEMMCKNI